MNVQLFGYMLLLAAPGEQVNVSEPHPTPWSKEPAVPVHLMLAGLKQVWITRDCFHLLCAHSVVSFFRWQGTAKCHTDNHLVAGVQSTPVSDISFSSCTLALELGALFLNVLCIMLCITAFFGAWAVFHVLSPVNAAQQKPGSGSRMMACQQQEDGTPGLCAARYRGCSWVLGGLGSPRIKFVLYLTTLLGTFETR